MNDENTDPNIGNSTSFKVDFDQTPGATRTLDTFVGNEREINSKQKSTLPSRDPRRRPLLDRVPFVPFSHGTMDSSQKKKNRHITPAYAYRSRETGLLEIRKLKDRCIKEDKLCSSSMNYPSVIYPIALNGGGVGVYTDPRDFASGGVNSFSQNVHVSNPTRGYVTFPWNLGDGTYSAEKSKERKKDCNDFCDAFDLEAGTCDKSQEFPKAISRKSYTSFLSPWKTWEKMHKFSVKFAEISRNSGTSNDCEKAIKNRNARVSGMYNEDDFDFAIILQPKEVYAYWAEQLDFRPEYGYEGYDLLQKGYGPPVMNGTKEGDNSDDSRSTVPCPKFCVTPTKSKKRHHIEITTMKEDLKNKMSKNVVENDAIADEVKPRTFSQGLSLFDRALASITPPKKGVNSKIAHQNASIRMTETTSLSSVNRNQKVTPPFPPRRWGNCIFEVNRSRSKRMLMSPPVVSIKGVSPNHNKTRNNRNEDDSKEEMAGVRAKKKRRTKNPNELNIEDIPTQVVPRGIAARTNGMDQFLWALKRGFVVRRHRPRGEAIFLKLSSLDGGDTIDYNFIHSEEAFISLKAQNVRYNKANGRYNLNEGKRTILRWSEESGRSGLELGVDATLPDYLAAEKYRDDKRRISGGIKRAMMDIATKTAQSGSFRASQIIAVHRAIHQDPYSAMKECGTSSLRASGSDYDDNYTFSLIFPTGLGWNGKADLKHESEKWHSGVGVEKSFRFLDIEIATRGEYWLMFRGFLLLQRDAAANRFHKDRRGGLGSLANRYQEEQVSYTGKDREEQRDCEPEEKTYFGRTTKHLCCLNAKPRGSETEPSPPPSDYFLGFKSPGTQIWGRLRQAGLETQRIYSLDTKKVMIKIRSPTERIMDVAEVLRLKLKTRDGEYHSMRLLNSNRKIEHLKLLLSQRFLCTIPRKPHSSI